MNEIRLVAFDLDDTLAPSKSRVDPEMAGLLTELIRFVPVCIISGGRFEQFSMQVLTQLAAGPDLARLHLMPTCGTQYYEWSGSDWSQVYSEELTDVQKAAVIKALTDGAVELGLWEDADLGTDHRGPRQPDHLLCPRSGGAGRREEELGSDRGQEGAAATVRR